jgi:farnesyl diphosphate synthase
MYIVFSIIEAPDAPQENNSNNQQRKPVPSEIMSAYPLKAIAKADKDYDKFTTTFGMLKDQMIDFMRNKHDMPEEALTWVDEMIQYNVWGGKLNRGVTVVSVQRSLVAAKENRSLTDLEVARSSVLGWAVEYLQAFFLVADDVMDDSETRRGQPCWYKQDKVAMIAINDSFLLESFVFTMIKQHFGNETYFHQLNDLFIEVIQQTEFGQLLDLTSQPTGEGATIDLSRFTSERYHKIVKYKTAFYTFYLPVAIGMITSGVTDQASFDLAKEICCEIGEYFQIQDDVLDCYGAPEVIGKVGTDIQDNKCSWLVVQALDKANAKQRKVLETNYGSWEEKKVQKVKALYRTLDLEALFEQYEEDSYQRIQEKLQQIRLVPKEVFELLLKKIYKRSK